MGQRGARNFAPTRTTPCADARDEKRFRSHGHQNLFAEQIVRHALGFSRCS